MKALSIKQPWPWLIINEPFSSPDMGRKDIENRKWKTRHRGPFLIHAAKTFDEAGYDRLTAAGILIPKPHEFTRGGIVGRADLVDCVTQSDSPWFSGPIGYVLKNGKPVPFHPCPGMPGFFDIPWPPKSEEVKHDPRT